MNNKSNQKKSLFISGNLKKLLIFISIFIVFALIFFYCIQSPAIINKFASVFKDKVGFDFRISDISFSSGLKGEIQDLYIAQLDEKNTSFSASHIQIEGRINQSLQGEIKSAVFKEPKLSMLFSGDRKSDLSFFHKLPAVDLLNITKGEVQFLFPTSGVLIKLTDVNLNLRDFSPQKGGKMLIKCQVRVELKDNEHEGGKGYVDGDLNFSSFEPTPIGTGNIRFVFTSLNLKGFNLKDVSMNMSLEMKKEGIIIHSLTPVTGSAVYKTEDKHIVLKNIRLIPYANYDIKKGEIYAGTKQFTIDNLGSFDINIHSIIKQNITWNASVKALSMNFEKTSEILKQFLPSKYKGWSFQGVGDLDAHMDGEYKENVITGGGKMVLQFKDGGFSSPKGDKAIQGASGKIILNIQIPTPTKKGQIDIFSETRLGEFLWDKYYKDFGNKKFVLTGSGNLNDLFFKSVELSGKIDLREAGKYHYIASMKSPKWNFNLKSEGIHLQELFSLFIRDYLAQDNPSLAHLQLSGLSHIEINLDRMEKGFHLNGIITLRDSLFNMPDNLLIYADLSLPFDFSYPASDYSSIPEDVIRHGNLFIKKIEAASFQVEELNIPIIISNNSLWFPQKIDIPFSGSILTLANLKVENLLSSERIFALGLLINNLELGLHIEKATGVNVPAKLNIELTQAIYKNDELKTNGSAFIDIFGGRFSFYNIYGRKLFSNSRVLGSDIVFENINLQELTQYIKLGRMSGIIKGSLKNFEIEYGQPSRFVLDIESVKTKGVAQNVSVDAIDNISIMGSGSQGMGTILRSGLSQFFKHYNYSRIGIVCILENDVFTIRGKIFEGGKEYLIRKGFLSGIDVINQNPHNNISFKDMKERLNRILEKRQSS